VTCVVEESLDIDRKEGSDEVVAACLENVVQKGEPGVVGGNLLSWGDNFKKPARVNGGYEACCCYGPEATAEDPVATIPHANKESYTFFIIYIVPGKTSRRSSLYRMDVEPGN